MWAIIVLIVILIPLSLLLFFAYQYWRFLGRLPKQPYQAAPHKPSPHEWDDNQVTVTWIGHSTLYINLFGTKIITDPVFGERVGMHLGLGWQIGPKRITSPALTPEEVGKADLILLRFYEVRELGGHEQIQVRDGVTVRAFPVRHWGNRYPWNHEYGWTGYVIEKKGVRLLFAGDTAYTPDFADLRKIGSIDVAFMPIGAYSPDSFQRAHCTPEQAWKMFQDSGARWFVPIHWDTFVLSQEPVDEPLQRLRAAAGPDEERIVLRQQGEVFRLPNEKE